MTRTETLARSAAVAEAGLGAKNIVTQAPKKVGGLSSMKHLSAPKSRYLAHASSRSAQPSAMVLTPNQLMLHAQHTDLNANGAVEWLEKLVWHEDEGVREAAVEAMTTRALPHLVQKSAAGASADATYLLALTEHPHDSISSLALDSLIQDVIPKVLELVLDGYAAKESLLHDIAKSRMSALREAASQALEQVAERSAAASSAETFEWID